MKHLKAVTTVLLWGIFPLLIIASAENALAQNDSCAPSLMEIASLWTADNSITNSGLIDSNIQIISKDNFNTELEEPLKLMESPKTFGLLMPISPTSDTPPIMLAEIGDPTCSGGYGSCGSYCNDANPQRRQQCNPDQIACYGTGGFCSCVYARKCK